MMTERELIGGNKMELQDRGYNTFTSLITTIIVAAGVLGQAFLYMILGINVSDVPVVVMIVLWVAISGVVKEVFEKIL